MCFKGGIDKKLFDNLRRKERDKRHEFSNIIITITYDFYFSAILSTGAYGSSMSSQYNSRGRSAEILVDKNRARLIRRRETVEDMYAHEVILSASNDI